MNFNRPMNHNFKKCGKRTIISSSRCTDFCNDYKVTVIYLTGIIPYLLVEHSEPPLPFSEIKGSRRFLFLAHVRYSNHCGVKLTYPKISMKKINKGREFGARQAKLGIAPPN